MKSPFSFWTTDFVLSRFEALEVFKALSDLLDKKVLW